MKWPSVSKSIAAFLTGALAWATAVVQSSPSNITAAEWIGLAGIFVTTALVWLVPNGEPASG